MLTLTVRTCRKGATIFVIKTQFGLGVLGLPSAFHTLGFVPAVIVLAILGAMCVWTGLMVGNFRLKHPSVYSVADAGQILFGRVGREVMGLYLWGLYSLSLGAVALGLSVAFNVFSDHAACTLAWAGMAAGISLIMCIALRSLKSLVAFGGVSVLCIFIAVWTVAIAALAQKRPAGAPPTGPIDKEVQAFSSVTFSAAMSAVSSMLFALCGTASFFTIHAEMKEPQKWKYSLLMGQAFVLGNYFLIACIVYGKVGVYVTSPALGSAGRLIAQIAYGIALPALFFTALFQIHVAAKYTFVRMLRGTVHLQKSTMTHWLVWSGSCVLSCVVGFIIAAAVPFFNELIGLIGSLFGTALALIVPCMMYIFDKGLLGVRMDAPETRTIDLQYKPHLWVTKGYKYSAAKGTLTVVKFTLAIITVICGLFICVAGSYGNIDTIVQTVNSGSERGSFSCADNSGSRK